MTDYVSSILLHKPDDAYAFTRDYFTKFNPEPIPNKPLIITGPSSVGKSMLIKELLHKFDDMELAVSVTSRQLGEGEDDRYIKISPEEFQQKIQDQELIEWSEVHGSNYGVLRSSFTEIVEKNKICILDIDVQGAEKLFMNELDANIFFVMPPDMKTLESRMREQGFVEEDDLRKRLRSS
jgi:guanylate kinase